MVIQHSTKNHYQESLHYGKINQQKEKTSCISPKKVHNPKKYFKCQIFILLLLGTTSILEVKSLSTFHSTLQISSQKDNWPIPQKRGDTFS